ncbi:MAG: hypothetical protein Q4B95_05235 [Lonepinella koalarum]|nr:hypothetical protein [Lonepinella koalarum]
MKTLSRLGSIIKRRKLMFIWMSFVIALSGDLIYKIFYVSLSPTLRFESFIFYIGCLTFFSFPLGTIMTVLSIILFSLLDNVLNIELGDIFSVILATTITTICFYIQWYILWPKLRGVLLKYYKS